MSDGGVYEIDDCTAFWLCSKKESHGFSPCPLLRVERERPRVIAKVMRSERQTY